jgi:hypothetical protein
LKYIAIYKLRHEEHMTENSNWFRQVSEVNIEFFRGEYDILAAYRTFY